MTTTSNKWKSLTKGTKDAMESLVKGTKDVTIRGKLSAEMFYLRDQIEGMKAKFGIQIWPLLGTGNWEAAKTKFEEIRTKIEPLEQRYQAMKAEKRSIKQNSHTKKNPSETKTQITPTQPQAGTELSTV